jgi:hypothetical protein
MTRGAGVEAGAARAGGGDGGATLAAKRTFTSRGCQQCKKRRRKCSQTRPCDQCVARGEEKRCCFLLDSSDHNAQQINRPLSSAQTLELTAESVLVTVKARELALPCGMGDFGAILLSRMSETGFPTHQMQNIIRNLPPSISAVLTEWFPVLCTAYAKRLCRALERPGAPQDPRSHRTIAGWDDHESSQHKSTEECVFELDQLVGHENWFSVVYDPVSGRRNSVHVGRGLAAKFGMHHEEFLARVAATDLPLFTSEVETFFLFFHVMFGSSFTATRVGLVSSCMSSFCLPTPTSMSPQPCASMSPQERGSSCMSSFCLPTPTERARDDAKRKRRKIDVAASSSPPPSDVSDTSSPIFPVTPSPPPASQWTALEASGAEQGCGRKKKKPQASIILVRQRIIKVMDSMDRVRQLVFGFEPVSERDFNLSERPFEQGVADARSYQEFLVDSAADMHRRGKMGYWKRSKAALKDMDRLSEVLSVQMRLTCSCLANE